MRITLALLAASLLSGCAALAPIIGGFASGGFGSAVVSGAGGVVGSEVARTEIDYVKAWHKCQQLYKTKRNRQLCIDNWRRLH